MDLFEREDDDGRRATRLSDISSVLSNGDTRRTKLYLGAERYT